MITFDMCTKSIETDDLTFTIQNLSEDIFRDYEIMY